MKNTMKFLSLALVTSLITTSTINAASNQKKSAINFSRDLVNKVGSDIANNADMPEYLKRIELGWDVSSEGKPEYDILTVQPLFQSHDLSHTIFTQARLAYGNDGRTTTNVGFGYRSLTLNQKLILGANTFFDYEFPYHHQRVGAGIEIKSSAIELYSNYYNAVTDWRYADTGYIEKALDGYDMELGTQLPYLPWAYIFTKKHYYDGITADNDTNGEKFSLRLRPVSFLEFEFGKIDDDETIATEYAKASVRVGWGNKSSKKVKLISNRAFEFNESVADKTLSKVRRSNTIRKERKSTNSGNTTISMQRAN